MGHAYRRLAELTRRRPVVENDVLFGAVEGLEQPEFADDRLERQAFQRLRPGSRIVSENEAQLALSCRAPQERPHQVQSLAVERRAIGNHDHHPAPIE